MKIALRQYKALRPISFLAKADAHHANRNFIRIAITSIHYNLHRHFLFNSNALQMILTCRSMGKSGLVNDIHHGQATNITIWIFLNCSLQCTATSWAWPWHAVLSWYWYVDGLMAEMILHTLHQMMMIGANLSPSPNQNMVIIMFQLYFLMLIRLVIALSKNLLHAIYRTLGDQRWSSSNVG